MASALQTRTRDPGHILKMIKRIVIASLFAASASAMDPTSPSYAARWIAEKMTPPEEFSPPVTNGLLAWYRFEGGSLDSVWGGAQTLTNIIAGTVVQVGLGAAGDGLIFDTSNRYALATAFVGQTNYPYTIVCRAAVTGAYLTLDFVAGINGDASSEYVAPIIFSSGWGAIHRATTQRNILPGAGYPTAEEWYHIAVVASNYNDTALYVDGVRIGVTASSAGTALTTPQAGHASFVIGDSTVFGSGSWAGWLDEVGFYAAALSSNQIKESADAIP